VASLRVKVVFLSLDGSKTRELYTIVVCRIANHIFVTQQGDTRDALIGALRRGNDCTWIVSFREHDVLWSGSGALANSFENVHI